MGIALVLAALVVAIGLVAGFGMGFFRLERVKGEEPPPSPSGDFDPEDLYPGEALDDLSALMDDPLRDDYPYDDGYLSPGEEGEQEPLDMFSYFADEEELEELLEPAEAGSPTVTESAEDFEFDKLGGFKAGRGFLIDCQKTLNLAKDDGRAYAFAYFDFDRFRFINSLKGASIGDYAISRLAQGLPDIFPDTSVISRLSADHFTVLFPLIDDAIIEDYTSQLKLLSERIREDIGAKSGLHISAGFAIARESDADYDIGILMQRANVARHCLKITKSETYSVYDDSMIQTYLYGDSAMEDYNENQFDDSEFMLYFQPLYDLRKGRVTGCETMALWTIVDSTQKKLTLTPDNTKLPTNNLKVFYQACRWMSRWRKGGKEVLLGLANLPITDFYKSDIDDYVGKCISAYQLEGKAVAVEIDASVLRVDFAMASRQLKKIRDIGASICIYGLDSWYTSLDFLEGLPVDYVKFHKSCSHDIAENAERHATVQNLIKQAADMGFRTIFEGVDLQDQGDLLKKAGAGFVQGRYAGDTCAPDDFIRLLQESLSSRSSGNATVILDESNFAVGDYTVY